MSMLSVLIKDLVEKTTLEDGTYLVAGTTDANKITFLNLVNAIKKKLGDAAQRSVANNLTTAAAGTSVLDAYQGKLLSDKIGSLNSTLLKIVEWTSWKFSIDTGQGMNLSDDYKPTVEGYTALCCLGGSGNGTASLICSLNGWVYNTGVKYSSVSVTYQWLFIKNS